MIVALAGRRIDAVDAEKPRFPLSNLELVRQRVRELLLRTPVTNLVSSAACGADLIALSEAGLLSIERRIVLPSRPELFRETSVIDRPGPWSVLYDRMLTEAQNTNSLVIAGSESDSDGYRAVNLAILDQAVALAQQLHRPVMALLIWDSSSAGNLDTTAHFGEEAKRRGVPVSEISTL